ncbi:hypothetical protein LshimejAT787_1600910 [Lyophyllum shimeji]|uniref:Uncharacterized protein n=1 Tax=Lyophyllum shimeji TaxID=47721 RepID=A0A9P3PZV6_LYOSH|nr:hypothetical protein LshimejAT787_1600910 [Lyophyllum shimeji]
MDTRTDTIVNLTLSCKDTSYLTKAAYTLFPLARRESSQSRVTYSDVPGRRQEPEKESTKARTATPMGGRGTASKPTFAHPVPSTEIVGHAQFLVPGLHGTALGANPFFRSTDTCLNVATALIPMPREETKPCTFSAPAFSSPSSPRSLGAMSAIVAMVAVGVHGVDPLSKRSRREQNIRHSSAFYPMLHVREMPLGRPSTHSCITKRRKPSTSFLRRLGAGRRHGDDTGKTSSAHRPLGLGSPRRYT